MILKIDPFSTHLVPFLSFSGSNRFRSKLVIGEHMIFVRVITVFHTLAKLIYFCIFMESFSLSLICPSNSSHIFRLKYGISNDFNLFHPATRVSYSLLTLNIISPMRHTAIWVTRWGCKSFPKVL